MRGFINSQFPQPQITGDQTLIGVDITTLSEPSLCESDKLYLHTGSYVSNYSYVEGEGDLVPQHIYTNVYCNALGNFSNLSSAFSVSNKWIDTDTIKQLFQFPSESKFAFVEERYSASGLSPSYVFYNQDGSAVKYTIFNWVEGQWMNIDIGSDISHPEVWQSGTGVEFSTITPMYLYIDGVVSISGFQSIPTFDYYPGSDMRHAGFCRTVKYMAQYGVRGFTWMYDGGSYYVMDNIEEVKYSTNGFYEMLVDWTCLSIPFKVRYSAGWASSTIYYELIPQLNLMGSSTLDGYRVYSSYWSLDTNASDEFIYSANIPISGVYSCFIPYVVFPSSLAETGNLSPYCDTYDPTSNKPGGLTIWAKSSYSTSFYLSVRLT